MLKTKVSENMREHCFVKVMHVTGIKPAAAGGQLSIRLVWGDAALDFQLEIDAFTYESLCRVLRFAEGYKYRLSFHMHNNKETGQYYGMLSGVLSDDFVQIHFPCSEEFLFHLNWVKDLDSMETLIRLLKQGIVSKQKQVSMKFSSSRFNKKVRHKIQAGVSIILMMTFLGDPALLFRPGEVPEVRETSLMTEISEVLVSYNLKEMETERRAPIPEVYVLPADKSVHWSLPKGYVALTFDDGPSVYTLPIAETLQEYGVGGTFFFIGTNVQRNPEITKKIDEMGHVIGNHSYSHTNLELLNKLNLRKEMEQFNHQVQELIGKEVTLFRPPYGFFNEAIRDVADELNMNIVLWNLDPKDWDKKNADEIVNHIKGLQPSGNIILLHENAQTLEALSKIIEFLIEEDLSIVMLSSILGDNGRFSGHLL